VGSAKVSVGEKMHFGGCSWCVLDIQGDKALILADRIQGECHFHDNHDFITWADCSLRKLLNDGFYSLFSQAEKNRIAETAVINHSNPRFGTNGGSDTIDKVFLLSIEEVVRYFGDSGQMQNGNSNDRTPIDDEYNEVRVARDNLGRATDWWLRSPGGYGTDTSYVSCKGAINIYGTFSIPESIHEESSIQMGVRPALWLDNSK
jgi:hypothetical protein